MSPTPTSPDQDTASPDGQHRITRKRNRVPLSCAPCRSRKLKCNRAQPCDNCIKRGDTSSCTYASSANRRRQTTSGGDIGTPDEMQNRIDRLESLVLSLMTSGSGGVDAETAREVLSRSRPSLGASSEQNEEDDDAMRRDDDSEVEHLSRSIGVIKVHNDRQFYASEAHWWTILSDIAEVKRYFAEHTQQYAEQVDKVTQIKQSQGHSAATSLLFKGTQKVDRESIINNFPPRQVADTLIQRYFNTENPATRMLHGPTFRSEYEKHWQRPGETSIVWLGMCFAMMSMALNSYHRAGDEPEQYRGTSHSLSETYAEYTAQCLVAADFTQHINYMVETLVLYALAEYSRRRDVETGLWMLQGMIVRLAMRMGMHRDSKPFASIGPFLGEMRRRVWSVIRTTDILLSFQCGLPSMVLSTDTDTALPTNVYDEEFYQGIQTLPKSRPSSENTPVSFMIAHTRIVYVLGRIQEHAMAISSFPAYEQTMKLDAELHEAYEQIPDHLRIQCRESSSLDSGDLVMQRFTLDLAFHKSVCVLHRKYQARARKDSRFAYSRRACVDACLHMLDHQSTVYREGQPGGRLRTVTWAIATSLTTHDFLLAAMIVCLDLYFTAQAESDGQTSGPMYQWAIERREEMVNAIERAVRIWETLKDQSMEAYKASSILKVMLEKLKNHQILRQQLHHNFSFSPPENNGVAADGRVAPEHSAALTLGMMSTGMTPDAMSGLYDRGFGNGQGSGPNMRTGLTPQPGAGIDSQGQQQNSLMSSLDGMSGGGGNGGSTPFNMMFGPGFGGFEGLDLPNTSLDWDGWDTYVHGPHRPDAFSSTNIFDLPPGFQGQFDTTGSASSGMQNQGASSSTTGTMSTGQTPKTEGFSPSTVSSNQGPSNSGGGLVGPAKFHQFSGPGAGGAAFTGTDSPNLSGL